MKFKRVYETIDNIKPTSRVEKNLNKSEACPHCKGKKNCPCIGTDITCKICKGERKCSVCNGSGRKESLKGDSFNDVFKKTGGK
jgi:hypothetical protein